ncbi:hypothetical protein ACUN0C_13730 [Faunimonas sp. B44]|uniref:hypothetical protein n=1 Tax=Faunimonas sp. B44 TaxID=3461493 RepID=UPI004043E75C
MRRLLLSAAALLVSASAGLAADLVPNHARSIELEGVSGVAYYTAEGSDYSVVAVLSGGEGARPVRYQTTLAPAQRLVISVPGPRGAKDKAVEIVRDGDAVRADLVE